MLQQEVHELDDLKDDLVLSDIIAVLVDNTVDLRVTGNRFPGQFILPAVDSEEIQLDWTHGRREYRATLSINSRNPQIREDRDRSRWIEMLHVVGALGNNQAAQGLFLCLYLISTVLFDLEREL